MISAIDFYFDFISPYSYLAHQKLKKLDKDNKININYKPILLGGLHKLGEITAPAFNERKMKNMKNDCELIAKKNKINFKWNEKFPINSLYLMRGYLVIEDVIKNDYFNTCFDSYWKENEDISDERIINQILQKCKIENNKFFKDIKDTNIKDELKNLQELLLKEIFLVHQHLW